jgi:signal transduction histidine kinase
MNDLYASLLDLDFDSDYTTSEISSEGGGRIHVARFLEHLLTILIKCVQVDRGFVALTGFEIGNYTPVASSGYEGARIDSLPTSGSSLPEAHWLHSKRALHVCPEPSSLVVDDRNRANHQIQLNLIGHGEIIGFICLERCAPEPFDQNAIECLAANQPLLTTLIAEQNFSIRVHRLAQPFHIQRQAGQDALPSLLDGIAELTALAFAADAVALRLYDATNDRLPVAAVTGEIEPDLIVDRMPGEHVAGRLLTDPEHDWAAISGRQGGPTGLPIQDNELQALRDSGVCACLIMRLASEASEDAADSRIGTLAYHIRRPHDFSWRDIALFRSFCRRVADAIALERQTQRLRESKEELELEQLLVLAQSAQVTNTDIITLIAHDLYHKSFEACSSLDTYMEKVDKLSRKPLKDEELEILGGAAMNAATEVQASLHRLRGMQQSANRTELEKPSFIKLQDAVNEVETVLGGPLKRNKITIKRNFGQELSFWGPRSIFGHIIFNLVINAIEVGRGRQRQTNKPMSIYINARKEVVGGKEKVIIQFWDEGPGINRQVFRDPNEIFQIGRTTKVNGTGTGLSVTRHLLNKHFRGSIELQDPTKALFRIVLPATAP